jgi:transcriptional regulatory protein LevR
MEAIMIKIYKKIKELFNKISNKIFYAKLNKEYNKLFIKYGLKVILFACGESPKISKVIHKITNDTSFKTIYINTTDKKAFKEDLEKNDYLNDDPICIIVDQSNDKSREIWATIMVTLNDLLIKPITILTK